LKKLNSLVKEEEVFEALSIHLMDGKICIKVKYKKLNKYKSQKYQKPLHPSPERAERFETKIV